MNEKSQNPRRPGGLRVLTSFAAVAKNKKENKNENAIMAGIAQRPAGRWRTGAPGRAGCRLPARIVLFGLFFFVILSPFLFAQSDTSIPVTGSLFSAQSKYGALIPLVIAGMAALSFFAALMLMVSRLFHSAEWETQAKHELYQIIVTLLWGLFLFGAAVAVDQITTAYSGGTMFDAAQSYLGRVTCVSSTVSIKLEGYKMAFQFLSGIRGRFYATPWGFSYPTYPGFEVIERAADLIQMFIIPFASSLYVQLIGIDIIHGTAMAFLMPVGILLRLLPPTREAGGFLIASSFALYFMLPLTYVIAKEVMEPLYAQEFGTPMCADAASVSSAQLSRPNQMFDSLAFNLWPDLSKDLLKMPKSISYVAVQAVFLPALSMIIVVTFIRTTMRFFSQGMGE